jgi:NAD(P)-dependent dehydrogenase (short-subunit alcohol dehydrogenase family)
VKSVLITGATGGIGKALVARFSGAGWRVHATDRKGALPLDVTSDESVSALREKIGVPDLVINNAGIGLLGPMAEIPDELIARQFDVNVRGLARVTRAFAPEMARRGNGRLINISSLAGVFTLPWFGAYAATKHAVEAVSDALRLELAPFGVDVVLIEPSIVVDEHHRPAGTRPACAAHARAGRRRGVSCGHDEPTEGAVPRRAARVVSHSAVGAAAHAGE